MQIKKNKTKRDENYLDIKLDVTNRCKELIEKEDETEDKEL